MHYKSWKLQENGVGGERKLSSKRTHNLPLLFCASLFTLFYSSLTFFVGCASTNISNRITTCAPVRSMDDSLCIGLVGFLFDIIEKFGKVMNSSLPLFLTLPSPFPLYIPSTTRLPKGSMQSLLPREEGAS